MGFLGPGISLVPSPTGSGRKVKRRVTLVPARKEHQKVSTLTVLPTLGVAVPRGRAISLVFKNILKPQ